MVSLEHIKNHADSRHAHRDVDIGRTNLLQSKPPASARDRTCRAQRRTVCSSQITTSSLDVSEATINPSFRSTPWEAEKNEDEERGIARIVFVSESNVCRSVLAEGLMSRLLEDSSLRDKVAVQSRATRDHQIGQEPEASTLAVAQELNLRLPENFSASLFNYEQDTVRFDLILVMDKFTAGDVMREISVYDTINKGGNYSQKVRRLGEFHPELGAKKQKGSDAQDIDDPLYGNVGGEEELEAVREAANVISDACRGLLVYLEQLSLDQSASSFPQALRIDINGKEEMDWLVPPMLQRR